MASSFVYKVTFLKNEQKKIINCFLNELRYFVEKKYGEAFWIDEKPN